MNQQYKLSDFELESKPLGSGYIAQIFRAFHPQTQKYYALKKIDVNKAGTAEKIALKREEKIHSTLTHPNIVQFFGSFYQDGKLYFVLELIEGKELFKYIQSKRDFLTEEETLYIIQQLLDAIAYIHQKGIIHRDIKPENIMINDQQQIKLVDFGFTAEYGLDIKTGHKIHRTTKCGTTDYFAPEVLNYDNQTDKVDIWCIGILTFELLHKRAPYQQTTFGGQFHNQAKKQNISFRQGISEEMKSFIKWILQYQPEKRPSAKEISQHSIFKRQGQQKQETVTPTYNFSKKVTTQSHSQKNPFDDQSQDYGNKFQLNYTPQKKVDLQNSYQNFQYQYVSKSTNVSPVPNKEKTYSNTQSQWRSYQPVSQSTYANLKYGKVLDSQKTYSNPQQSTYSNSQQRFTDLEKYKNMQQQVTNVKRYYIDQPNPQSHNQYYSTKTVPNGSNQSKPQYQFSSQWSSIKHQNGSN